MITQATVKAITDTMRRDVGIDGDAQRLGQMVWMFFLKVLDDREVEWEIFDEAYVSPLPEQLRWRTWAAPDEGITGTALFEFINNVLFPTLKELPHRVGANPAMTEVVRGVFSDAFNYMKSGTLTRQVVNVMERDLDYNTNEDRHAFGDIYESLLKGLQSAGDAGEYYTPRPVTELMVELSDPQLGETVLDPAAGTGGFLLCTLNHKRDRYVDSVADDSVAQQSLRGVEKKPLPHLLCVTNMMLHGVDVPTNIRRGNTLSRPLRDYGPGDQVDIVITNPPFQGMEEDGIGNNFPGLKSRETADLFLALTLRILKSNGRGAIVLPDSSLFGEGAKQVLRSRLLNETNLHTIIRLPVGVFSPYTDIRTNILFFDKGPSTDNIWFYEIEPGAGDRYTKTKPIKSSDFDRLRDWWGERKTTSHSWSVPVSSLDERLNLNIPNPASADIEGAYSRALVGRRQAVSEYTRFKSELAHVLSRAPGPIGDRVFEFTSQLAELGGEAAASAGVVEDLRVALTGLALRGELSGSEPSDLSIEDTLSSFVPADRPRVKPFTPPPFEIPGHWKWVQLSDITDWYIGRTPSTQNHRYWAESEHGESAWVSISDMPRRGLIERTARFITESAIADTYRGHEPVASGSLLMAFKLSVGKTAITGIETFHNEAIASFATKDEVLKRYLLWALPSVSRYAGSNPAVRGRTLNTKSLNAMWVPIPPRPEQERLIANLRWVVEFTEELALRTEEVRGSAGTLMKALIARAAI